MTLRKDLLEKLKKEKSIKLEGLNKEERYNIYKCMSYPLRYEKVKEGEKDQKKVIYLDIKDGKYNNGVLIYKNYSFIILYY